MSALRVGFGHPTLESLLVFERTDAYVIAAWRRLGLLVWKGETNVTGIERSRKLIESWAKRQHQGVALLIVVPARRARPPNDECRAAMSRVGNSSSDGLRGMATLVEAEGFIAATAQMVAMPFMSQGSGNVFRSPSKAADWAASLLGDPDLSTDGLARAIALLQGGK